MFKISALLLLLGTVVAGAAGFGFMAGGPANNAVAPSNSFLLLESSDKLLLEDGSKLVLE